MRGKLGLSYPRLARARITPACAGKTLSQKIPHFCLTDHPRVCGENAFYPEGVEDIRGSPPRVRGKQGADGSGAGAGRITPACAGKTFVVLIPASPYTDHPRVCGENRRHIYDQPRRDGSPPRVRGKRAAACPWSPRARITPACAGKTAPACFTCISASDHPRVCGENGFFCVCVSNRNGSPPRVRGKHFGNGVFPWLILVLSLDPL